MTLTDQVIKNIIKRLIQGQDYRIEVVALLNAEFLQFSIDFFKKVVVAKLSNKDVTLDWYKANFLTTDLRPDDFAIHAGLNKKTIMNMYNSATKEIVLDAANEHYEILHQSVSALIETEPEMDLTLTIKFRGVSVDLNINESLMVINTLAVKRSALRGGAWSLAGKKTEKLLMRVLCRLFEVPTQSYSVHAKGTKVSKKIKKGATMDADFDREIDFFLMKGDRGYKCEVKLMGAGNSESADTVIARDSDIFIADKLSLNNKKQLDSLGIHWVELRNTEGYRRFLYVLEHFGIPHQTEIEDLDAKIDAILNELMPNFK